MDAPAPRTAAPTARDTLAAAEARFDRTLFDTIQWSSAGAAAERGAFVWRVGCMQCHGPEGRGDAKFVNEQGDTLRPPSFVAADWTLAHNPDGIRHKVFIGNMQGMPHWGLRRMTPRDIDAVAQYIVARLRTQ
jgi:mono/diheme cytochrome c family protein